MKKQLRYGALAFALLLLLVVAVGLGWASYAKLRQHRERAHQLALLPSFRAYGLDGQQLALPWHAAGSVVLIYFEPDCDHCQRQARDMSRHAPELGTTHVVWLSKDSLAALRSFAQQYSLLRPPMMQVAQIKPEVATALHFFSVPDIRLYNADHRLVQRYKGETRAAAIISKL